MDLAARAILETDPEERRELCVRAMDQLFDDWVVGRCIGSARPSCRVLGVDAECPHPDLVERRRTELEGRLWRFIGVVRDAELFVPVGTRLSAECAMACRDIESQLDCIVRAFEAHCQTALGYARWCYARETSLVPPRVRDYDDKRNPVLVWALAELRHRHAWRLDGMVMVPVMTAAGIHSRTFRPLCGVTDFVRAHLVREREPKVWAACKCRGVAADVNEALAVGVHPAFPDLAVDQHAFSFANGLYRVGTNTFVPHRYPGPVPNVSFEVQDVYDTLAAPMSPAEIIPLYAGSDPNLDAAAVYFEAELTSRWTTRSPSPPLSLTASSTAGRLVFSVGCCGMVRGRKGCCSRAPAPIPSPACCETSFPTRCFCCPRPVPLRSRRSDASG